MSVRAGLRNPYTQYEDNPVRERTRSSVLSREPAGSDEESIIDGRVSVLPSFDPARVSKKKRTCSLANRKDVKHAMRSFKGLLKPGSRSRIRYGIMVSNAFLLTTPA